MTAMDRFLSWLLPAKFGQSPFFPKADIHFQD